LCGGVGSDARFRGLRERRIGRCTLGGGLQRFLFLGFARA
jgi:hypothetical protein